MSHEVGTVELKFLTCSELGKLVPLWFTSSKSIVERKYNNGLFWMGMIFQPKLMQVEKECLHWGGACKAMSRLQIPIPYIPCMYKLKVHQSYSFLETIPKNLHIKLQGGIFKRGMAGMSVQFFCGRLMRTGGTIYRWFNLFKCWDPLLAGNVAQILSTEQSHHLVFFSN